MTARCGTVSIWAAYDYAAMLEAQMAGRRDIWGIRWYWSVFCQNGLSLFPPQSLVRNTGQDGSGTHGGGFLRKFSPPGRGIRKEIRPLCRWFQLGRASQKRSPRDQSRSP